LSIVHTTKTNKTIKTADALKTAIFVLVG